MKIGQVSELFVYPVKSMSAQQLPSVRVSPEHGFPFDRVFALAHHGAATRREFTEPLQPNFHMLTVDHRLAGLRTYCDPTTGHFEVFVQEHLVFASDLSTPEGCSEAGKFFAAVLDLPNDKPPVMTRGLGHNYAWLDSASCHIVNLASVRDLSERAGVEIDPLRFRANLYIDTDEPWTEFEWIGEELKIGENVLMTPSKRATRCAATEVNRDSAIRDVPIPRLLKRHYGHSDFGIYTAITKGGLLKPAMAVERRHFREQSTVDGA